jgi:beta-phosphoglucomutase
MEFKAYLFDMDGTLVDNMGIHNQVWIEFLRTHGVNITPAEFYERAAGRTNAEILRHMIGPHLEDVQIMRMSAQKEELYRSRYRPIMKPVPGLSVFLQLMRTHGIAAAVASSAGHENIEFHLSGLGLRAYFDAVVGAEDVRLGKPAPDLFLTAAARLGIAPADCLVFEDSPAGLEAACRAGMQAVAFTTSYPANDLSSNPAVMRIEADFTRISPLDLSRTSIASQ